MDSNITVRAAFGTKDSYETRNIYPKRDIEDIIRLIKDHPYNRYYGGRQDSMMASIDFYKAGYAFNDCIKLQFTSEENCREFEEAIKPYVEHFSPRKYEVGE